MCTIAFGADTGNIRKFVNFTYTLKILNYKLPVFRTNFWKQKVLEIAINNINPQNGVAYKKMCMSKINTKETKLKQSQWS